jgi:hypothetical protein
MKKNFMNLKFKDVIMILFNKLKIVLIALEIKIDNQTKVFVNPSEYVLGNKDYWGYVIDDSHPDYNKINKELDLSAQSSSNFFITEYIKKKE